MAGVTTFGGALRRLPLARRTPTAAHEGGGLMPSSSPGAMGQPQPGNGDPPGASPSESFSAHRFRAASFIACVLLLPLALHASFGARGGDGHGPVGVDLPQFSDVAKPGTPTWPATPSGSDRGTRGRHGFERSHAFESLADELYDRATKAAAPPLEPTPARRPFDLASWTKRTKGGLHDPDRIKVADIYGATSTSSVFEWGLGESTRIAAHVGVPRYAGVDSDASYVASARDESPGHFRFYFADIGKTGSWGRPADRSLPKIRFDYQLAPLLAERDAFDVYMVDGQMRELCAIAALLHSGQNRKGSLVLVHDYYHSVHSRDCSDCRDWAWQRPYHALEQVADLVDHSGGELAVFKRKPHVTDQQLLEFWHDLAKKEK